MTLRNLVAMICLLSTLPVVARIEEGAQSGGYDINFSGGSLAMLFQVIQAQNQRSANVVLDEEVKEIEVAPLQLKGVSMTSLAETLTWTLPKIGARYSDNLVSIHRMREDVFVSIYNIQHLVRQEDDTQGYLLEDIATTIETGWEMYDNSQDPQMKIHQGTHLIIVQGTKGEHGIVREILEQLTRPDQRMMMNVKMMEGTVKRLRSEIRSLESALKSLSRISKDLEARKAALEGSDVAEASSN